MYLLILHNFHIVSIVHIVHIVSIVSIDSIVSIVSIDSIVSNVHIVIIEHIVKTVYILNIVITVHIVHIVYIVLIIYTSCAYCAYYYIVHNRVTFVHFGLSWLIWETLRSWNIHIYYVDIYINRKETFPIFRDPSDIKRVIK